MPRNKKFKKPRKHSLSPEEILKRKKKGVRNAVNNRIQDDKPPVVILNNLITTYLDNYPDQDLKKYAFIHALNHFRDYHKGNVNFENIVRHRCLDLLKLMQKYNICILPKRPLLKILAMNRTEPNHYSYWSQSSHSFLFKAQRIIRYLVVNKLDILTDQIVDELVKFTQTNEYDPKDFLTLIFKNHDAKKYLNYLATYKSNGLTIWFNAPRGHVRDTRLGRWEHLRVMWPTRLPIILEHNPSTFGKIIKMMRDLSKNSEKFYESTQFYVTIIKLIQIYFCQHADNDLDQLLSGLIQLNAKKKKILETFVRFQDSIFILYDYYTFRKNLKKMRYNHSKNRNRIILALHKGTNLPIELSAQIYGKFLYQFK